MSLNNSNIVITGASSGIGTATATLLAQQGAIIHAQGRNQNRLNELSQNILKQGGQIHSYALELTNDADLKSFAEALEQVDTVIHSAGVVSLASLAGASGMIVTAIQSDDTG